MLIILGTVLTGYADITPVSDRTPQIRDAIVAEVPGVDSADDVTEAHLAGIVRLSMSSENITALKEGDFDGLTSMTWLEMGNNQISSLPADVFAGLTSLTHLIMPRNQISSLPAGIFSDLTSINLIILRDNQVATLPAGLFKGLSSLTEIYLKYNQISSLPTDVFSGLSSLTKLDLSSNEISSLPADVFSGLSSLTTIELEWNQLNNLSAGLFAGLSSLTTIKLGGNQLTTLPTGLFSGLSSLDSISLYRNQLSSLPMGIFSGLSSLTELILFNNAAELSLIIELQQVGVNQFKAVMATGAPFTIVVPINVTNGSIMGGATTATIPIGSVESTPFTVIPTPGTSDAVSLLLGTLPDLPSDHRGYRLAPFNFPPEFVEGPSTIRTVAEDIHTGGDVGTTVSATDPYNDPLTYTLSGTDASSFTIDATTGQLRTSIRLDYETQSTYMVTVNVTDGTLNDSIAVTINVTNVEPEVLNAGEPRTVRLFYFLPNDRPYRQEVVDAMKTGILEVQSFYAEQMAAHGHGNTTFNIEADAQGEPIVHRINGDNSDSRYASSGYTDGEIIRAFDTSTMISAIVMDVSHHSVRGRGTGNKSNGWLIIYEDWDWFTAAHELAHAFGLHHDYRDNSYVLSYGTTDRSTATLSAAAAEFLSVHPYFNTSIPLEIGTGPTVELVSPTTYPAGSESVNIRVRVRDDTGLHQAMLFVRPNNPFRGTTPELKMWQKLDGETDTTVVFNFDGRVPSDGDDPDMTLANTDQYEISVMAVDTEGNWYRSNFITLEAGEAQEIVPVSDRTPQVRDAIVAIVPGVNFARGVTAAHLANIVYLDLRNKNIKSLKQGDFSGLSALDNLDLSNNKLSSLPAGVFDGLSALKILNLYYNELSSLPIGVFHGLSALTRLTLFVNELTTLPAGVFDGLSALSHLNLSNNELSSLPAGIFSGLSSLTTLNLKGNAVYPMPLTVSLVKVGADQFKVDVPTGAPSDMDIPLIVVNGTINGGVERVTIPTGSVRSDVLTVTRTPGTTAAVIVDLERTVPSPTGADYVFYKSFPHLEIFSPLAGAPTPVSERTPQVLDAIVAAVPEIDHIHHDRDIRYLIGGQFVDKKYNMGHYVSEAYLAAITNLDVFGVSGGADLSLSGNWFSLHGNATELKLGDFDGMTNLAKLRLDGNELSSLPGDLFDNLTNLTTLNLSSNELSSLPEDLFDNLTNLTTLNLDSNELSSLPAGLFDNLSNLTYLNLLDNPLGPLSEGYFDNLTKLTTLHLPASVTPPTTPEDSKVTPVADRTPQVRDAIVAAAGVNSAADVTAAHLAAITELDLQEENIAALKQGDFDNLHGLDLLVLNGTFSSLPSGIFDQLVNLRILGIAGSQLNSLSSDIFDNLTNLKSLGIVNTQLRLLPDGIFDNLTNVPFITLSNNQLSSLPDGIFDKTTMSLDLSNNQLSSLPDGIFEGIFSEPPDLTGFEVLGVPLGQVLEETLAGTDYTTVNLTGNLVNPMPLTVSLEKVADGQFKAVTPAGAPFKLVLPIRVVNGSINGGVESITIPVGSVESDIFTVTRTSGTTYATTVNIGTLPQLPKQHSGYTLVKSDALPLVFSELGGSILTPVNQRSPQVRDAIVAAVPGVNSADDVTAAHLAAITSLSFGLSNPTKVGDFDGLTGLTRIGMGTDLTSIPEGFFNEFSNLTFLDWEDLQLSSLPAGIFDNLTNLTSMSLGFGQLSSLPDGIFDNLTNLTAMSLGFGQLSSLPVGIFDNLTNLTAMSLGFGQLSSFPDGIFDNLTNLTRLRITNTQMLALPDGLLSGVSSLTSLSFFSNAADPMPFTVSLEKIGAGQFKAVAPTGAPFDIVLPIRLTNGRIDGGASSITIPAGSVESTTLTVTRTPGATYATTINIGTLPSLPQNHTGYSLVKSVGLPLAFPELGGQVFTSVGSRTPQVAEAILGVVRLNDPNVSSFAEITNSHLTGITALYLNGRNITSLKSGDFEGLSSLEELRLHSNQLTSLPEDIFSGLTALTTLTLYGNQLTTLPPGIFNGLSSLSTLRFGLNQLTTLPAGLFDGLNSLTDLRMIGNQLSELPEGIFVGLTGLTTLSLGSNAVDPLLLTVSLEKVGNGQFKAVAPTGAPFDMVLPITVTDGSISGGATTLTIPAGSVESEVLTVTRTPGATYATTVNIGTLRSQPGNHTGYSLVKSVDLPLAFPELGGRVFVLVSDRTPQVRDVIVAAVPGVNSPNDVTEAHLAAITRLNFWFGVSQLKIGDFDGLSSLTSISIDVSEGSVISEDAITNLPTLNNIFIDRSPGLIISEGAITNLPALNNISINRSPGLTISEGAFTNLPAFTLIWIERSSDLAISKGTFSNLPALTTIRIETCRDLTIPEGVFSNLPALTDIRLSQNNLTTLPENIFDNLTTLEYLDLSSNNLTALPDGLFEGLTSLTTLRLNGNAVNPMPLSVTLETVAEGQFKAVAPTGAPFDIVLPISVSNGSISGGATSLTIPTGSVESDVLTVTRTPSVTFAVSADIGTLPGVPTNHTGYTLVKSANLPIEVISEVIPIVLVDKGVCKVGDILTPGESCTYPDTDAVFSVIADGKSQWNIPGLPDWLASFVNRISINDSMSIISTVNGKTYRFEARAVENNSWQIEQIGDRTQESIASGINIPDANLRTKIEDALNKSSSDTITITEMETLTSLNGQDSSISDLTGLETATNLTTLKLGNNAIVDISALANLTKLTELQLWDNQITTLSDLSGLTNLTTLYLWGNTVSDISDLSGLTSLMQLRLGENSITNIGTVSNLTNLTQLYLNENTITDISAVAGLTNLTELRIGDNTISDITPVQNLTNLEWLDIPNNSISDISAVQNLTSLVELYFQNNSVSDLSPLVANTGFGEFTELDAQGNPLSYPSIYTYIPALQAKDVYIDFDNRVATVPVKISGDTQQDKTGALLTLPFIVEVKDADSVIFAGVPVTFAITAGGGTLSSTSTTTDVNGRAQSTLTLGDAAGTNTVSVSVAAVTQTITFTATATAPVVVYITPVGDRTSQVAQAILGVVRLDYPTVSNYAEITATHIASPTTLYLNNRNITTLKSGDFDGLTGLEDLRLNNNQLTSLPSNIFSGLTALSNLNLFNNQLSSLPNGIFEGLTSLTKIRLAGNAVDPLPVTVSLEKVAEGQFKAVAPTGAPFTIVLPINVANGSITGSATTLTIPQGSLESDTLNVTRTAGTTADVTIDIGTLPSLPRNHFGYALVKPDDLPLAVITSINTAPVFTDGTAITRTVTENTVATTNIGTPIAATDTENDTLTYTLSGTDASAFDIDNSTGQLKTKTTLDYETKNTYTVTITVSDGSLTDTITVTINITDIDEAVVVDPPTTNVAPTFTDGESTTRVVSENTAAGTNIGNPVNATDANNDTLTYSLGGIDATSFDIDSTTGQLKTEASLDYENKRVYSVTITATDDELSDTITVIISVIDVNDTVLSIGFVPVADRTSQVRDAIVAAVPNVADAASVTESQVAAITSLNLRSKGISSLKTGDFSGMTALTTLNLFRNQLSELPPGIFDGLTALSTLRLGDNVVDPLPLFVSLQSVGTGQFKAVITTGAPFSMVLPITVTDGSISSGITSVTIPQGRAESTSFTVIGTAAKVSFGTFPSIPQGHFGYTLTQFTVCNRTTEVADAIAAAVGVSDCSDVTEVDLATITRLDLSGSAITSLQTGDFDGMVSLRTLYLENNDLTSLPNGIFDDLVSLTFLSLNENKLTTLSSGIFSKLTSLTHLDIFDNDMSSLPSSVFTGLSALTSLSLKNNELTYLPGDIFSGLSSLTSLSLSNNKLTSLTAGIFEGLTQLSQLHLSLNPNANTLLTLRISLQKVGTNSVKAVVPSGAPFTMTIPVQIENGVLAGGATTMTIPIGAVESQPLTITRTAGAVAAVTADVGTALPRLPSNHNGYNILKSRTLPLEVLPPLNSPPVFTEGASTTRTILENTATGINIGDAITATDVNTADTLTYTLRGTDAAAFDIDSTTGQLKTKAVLDFETKNTYSVTLTVSDSIAMDTIAVTINILNVNEAPEFAAGSPTTHTVAENTAAGENIGTAYSATDVDGDTLTYSLSGQDAAAFGIDTATGQLKTSAALDYETKTIYSVTITVSDGKLNTSITVTINVTDVDELPTDPQEVEDVSANNAPVFTDGETATRTVVENTSSGVVIGLAVSATDADNDTLTYTLDGTDASAFDIDGLTGQLKTKAALDYETKTTYTVTITASDGSLTATIEVTINVTDVAEVVTGEDGTSTDTDTDENGESVTDTVTDTDTDENGESVTDTDTNNEPASTVRFTPVSERTSVIRDIIVRAAGVESAGDVTETHLASIKSLSYSGHSQPSLSTLKIGDFDGLTGLTKLSMADHSLSSLPDGIFDDLTSLTTLTLRGFRSNTPLSSLPAGIFDNLTKLTYLNISENSLSSLPTGVFDNLTKLTYLNIGYNSLSSLPDGIFDNLTELIEFWMFNNQVSSLPDGIFDNCTSLTALRLGGNGLSSLQADVFDNLSALSFLTLGSNNLSSLPEGIFDNLSALTSLFLHANGIVSFPDGIFDNLSALTYLNVYNNPIEDFEQLRRLKANNPGIEIFGIRIPEEDDNGAPALPAVPSETTLLANFPNPFNPETWIPYQLAKPAKVTLTIYSMRGVVVQQLKLGQKPAGVYLSRSRAIHWDGRNSIGEKVAAGVYFYTLTAGEFSTTRKMLIRK